MEVGFTNTSEKSEMLIFQSSISFPVTLLAKYIVS